MDELPSIRPPHSVPSYVGDGARIAAILLVWGIIAVTARKPTRSRVGGSA